MKFLLTQVQARKLHDAINAKKGAHLHFQIASKALVE